MRLPLNLIAKPGSLLLSMATALSWIVVLVSSVAASTIMWLLIRFGIIVFSLGRNLVAADKFLFLSLPGRSCWD